MMKDEIMKNPIETEDTAIENSEDKAEAKNPVYIVKFKKSYNFEGKEITELDLTPYAEYDLKQMKRLDKLYEDETGLAAAAADTSIEFAEIVVHVLTGMPIRFIDEKMGASDIKAVRQRLLALLGTKGDAIPLSKPVKYQGGEIKEVDLSRFNDMNAATLKAVESAFTKFTGLQAYGQFRTLDFAAAVIHIVTGLPFDVIRGMNGIDIKKVRLKTALFFTMI